MDISTGMHDISFEVIRVFQQERVIANTLLSKAADALVRRERWLANDARLLEELQLFQQIETIPHVGIDYIRKAMKAKQSYCWSTPEKTQASLRGW